MMKKFITIVTAFMMTFACMTACGDSSQADSSKTNSSSSAETTTTKEEGSSESKTETTTTTTQATTTVPQNKNRVVLDVKNIQQKPELPRGSEITCATMVLNYYGFNVSKMDMLKYLPIVEAPDANGVWVSIDEAYVGNPKSDTGYGCSNAVIEDAIDNYLKAEKNTDYEVKDPVITNFVDLYEEINKNNPVIIWVSTDMTNIIFSEKCKEYLWTL
ncbi:MAG: C39 family peptidase [Ruminococcus sp.]|nr:C39 family peptidase [Ruminococcus sp.]